MLSAKQSLGEFTILTQETEKFARLSGDYNPMHLNPTAARRFNFGGTVVHGVHACLRAMDIYLSEASADRFEISKLSVSFDAPIRTGKTAALFIKTVSASNVKLLIYVEGLRSQSINIAFKPGSHVHSPSIDNREPPRRNFQTADVENQRELAGELQLYLDRQIAAELFPNLPNLLTELQASQVLATTRLIGMECPGLRSVYSGLNLTFSVGMQSEAPVLIFKLASYDQRFRLARLQIRSWGLEGSLEAFVRPVPIRQATFKMARNAMPRGRFRSERAMVIGGSRGLGEVTAKLLAAGGADVIITYHLGKDDADQLVGEIRLGGGLCRAIPFDVKMPAETAPELLSGNELITHLYYFATPHIESNPHEWKNALFLNFREYFVDGLKRTIDTLYNRWNCCAPRLKVFYPSTIFLDNPENGLAEYTAAKAAGEEACRQHDRFSEEIRFFVPRLPRMLTDQTNTIIGMTTKEPLSVMREALLNFARFEQNGS